MKKLFIIIVILSFRHASLAQDNSRHEADILLSALERSKADTARISLLLKLAEFQIFKPGEFKQDLDSAAAYIEKAKVLTTSLKSTESIGFTTLVEAFLTKERGQRDEAKKMVERAIAIISTQKDKSKLPDAYFELSDYYDYNVQDQLPKKIKLVEQAVAGFQQTKNKERQGYCLKVLADLYGDPSKVLQTLALSLEAYKSINYTQLQGVYTIYGSVYYEQGNYKQSLNYELLALKSAESCNDTSMNLCQIYNTIGIILTRLDEKEKAIDYFKIALQIAEKYNDNTNAQLLLTNIIDSYNKMGKPEEGLKIIKNTPGKFLIPRDDQNYYVRPYIYLSVYYNLNDNKKARIYADQLPVIIKAHKPRDRDLNNVYHLIISYYIRSGQLKAAGIYLKKIDSLSRKIGNPNRINLNNYLKFRLDTALGNFKSAVYNLLNYNKISDSLFNETKSKQIKQLEIDYETTKKEDSIKIKDKSITVLNQQNQLQNVSLQRANLLRKFTFGGIALMLFIMGLLYRQYRNKQQTNQTIMHKNELLEHLVTEKEWLLKEVHHRVKNNLQTVVSLLELQSENLQDEALSAIHDSQNRIYAMSLIHQKLYQTDKIASINMQPYLQELTNHLQAIYNPERKINFDVQVTDLEMDVSQAIPVGLIVNEAVTNSIKYAFNQSISHPDISIILEQNNKQDLKLIIADNGVGLPPLFDSTDTSGLGFKLMNALAEDIEGKLTVESKSGTFIKVFFNASITFDKRSEISQPEKTYAI
ncbi:MAG: histidine kinase dimerization/phosphoacceptor domain -containing protein [Ginsengibacter sp.]